MRGVDAVKAEFNPPSVIHEAAMTPVIAPFPAIANLSSQHGECINQICFITTHDYSASTRARAIFSSAAGRTSTPNCEGSSSCSYIIDESLPVTALLKLDESLPITALLD